MTKTENINKTKTIVVLLLGCIIAILLSILLMDILSDNPENRTLQSILYIFSLFMVGYLFYFSLRLFFKGVDLINYNAYLMAKGELNISDIILDKAKGLETLCIAFNDMKTNLLTFTELTKTNIVIISDAVDEVTKEY